MMRYLKATTALSMALLGGTAFGQQAPQELLAVGPDGTVLKVLMPNDDALSPIVNLVNLGSE